jgi:peptide/nickel transport system permease protein
MSTRRRHRGNVPLIIGLVTLASLVVLSLFAGLIASHPPEAIVGIPLLPPSGEFPLGTDEVGRDLLSRILYGGRAELFISLSASLLAAVAGVVIGLLVGLRGGFSDTAAMRGVEIIYSIPAIVLAMFLIAVLGRGSSVQILAISLVLAPFMVRLSRGLALQLRPRAFVEASRLSGGSTWHVVWKHVAPNALPTVIVATSLSATAAITIAASLSYLGLGVRPPAPSWGTLMRSAYDVVFYSPWYGVVPGVLISLTALSYTLIGTGLRRRLGITDLDQRSMGQARAAA